MLDLLAVGPKFTRPAYRAAAAAIDPYLLSAPDLSSKPSGSRCCYQSTRQTNEWTLDHFMTLTTYYADRVINISIVSITITQKAIFNAHNTSLEHNNSKAQHANNQFLTKKLLITNIQQSKNITYGETTNTINVEQRVLLVKKLVTRK